MCKKLQEKLNWMFSGTAQVSHQVCQFFCQFCECFEIMLSWCQQVNGGNCGSPWVNCVVLCVKDDWKGQFWGLRYCLSKIRSLLSFSRQSWRHAIKSLSLTESVYRPLETLLSFLPNSPWYRTNFTEPYGVFFFHCRSSLSTRTTGHGYHKSFRPLPARATPNYSCITTFQRRNLIFTYSLLGRVAQSI